MNGTDADFFVAQDWSFESGRPFSDGEVRSGSAVCVIGQTIKTVLFGPIDPLGERIRIGNVSCSVIGVLIGKGQSAMGTDQDEYRHHTFASLPAAHFREHEYSDDLYRGR